MSRAVPTRGDGEDIAPNSPPSYLFGCIVLSVSTYLKALFINYPMHTFFEEVDVLVLRLGSPVSRQLHQYIIDTY